MKAKLCGTILLVMMMVAGPAGAESRYAPPYEHPSTDVPTQCSSGSTQDTTCRSSAEVDAASGSIRVEASVASPRSGLMPGVGGIQPSASVDMLHEVPEETPAVRGIVILNIASARVSHTCPIICPLGGGTAQIRVIVDGDPQACGWNCAKRYEHRLLDITNGPTDPIAESVVEIPFELVRDRNPYGKIPAGPMWITVRIEAQVGLRSSEGTQKHALVGSIDASFSGVLESVVVE